MQPMLLLCIVVAILAATLVEAERIGQQVAFGSTLLGKLRGGAKGKVGSSKSKNRRHTYDDDDDEEDEDNHRSGRRASNIKKGKAAKSHKPSHKASTKSKMQLMPWGQSPKAKGSKKSGSGTSIRERLEAVAKTGQAAYKDLYRKAKVLKSSAFEGILLKATWPGNDPVPPELLSEIVKYSIPSFKYAHSDSEDDPYYMTLHKLWTKMCEKDWRTVTKSLYILHCISRDSSTEACTSFAAALKDLSKTRNPKKPDHKYFDLRKLGADLDTIGQPFESFVAAYGTYVINRAKLFSNKFEELKDITETTAEKKTVAVLKRAQTLVKAALHCTVGKKERNIIDGQAMKLVATDLKELWQLYTEKLAPLAGVGASYGEPKATTDDVKQALNFFSEYDTKVKAYLAQTAKDFVKLRLKIPSSLDEGALTVEKATSRIDELLKLSGGAVKKPCMPSEEDEEEDEEDDEGDDEEDEEDEEDDNEEEDEDDDAADDGETDDKDEDDDDKGDGAEDEDDDEETEDDTEEEDEEEDDEDDYDN